MDARLPTPARSSRPKIAAAESGFAVQHAAEFRRQHDEVQIHHPERLAKASKTVTFMYPNPAFSGQWLGHAYRHKSLWKKGKPLFAGAATPGLSRRWRCSVRAGLLKHHERFRPSSRLRVCRLGKRLVPGYEAPVATWPARRNRSAARSAFSIQESPKSEAARVQPPDPLVTLSRHCQPC